MSDIDLVLSLVGTEQASSKLGSLDQTMGKFRGQALQSINAIRGMEGAFDMLTGKAELNATSLTQLSSVLPLLTNPAGIATVAIGAMAVAMSKLNEAAKELEKADLARILEAVHGDASAATAGWNAYYAAIISGAPKAEQELKRSAAEEMDRFNTAKSQRDQAIKGYQEQIDALIEANRSIAEQRAEMETTFASTPAFARSASLAAEQEALLAGLDRQMAQNSASIAIHNQNIRNQNASLITNARTVAGTTEALRLYAEQSEVALETDHEFLGILRDLNREREKELELIAKQNEAAGASAMSAFMGGAGAGGGKSVATAEAVAEVDHLGEAYDRLGESIQASLIGGAVSAFDAYAAALDETIALNAIFAGGFDRSMRNVAASTLRSIGQQATVEGAMSAAKAIRDYSDGNLPGAIGHTKAAGMFFGVAALAGVASGAMSVSASGGGGASAGGGGGSFGGGNNGGDNVTQNITIIGTLDAEAAENLYGQLAEAAENRSLSR